MSAATAHARDVLAGGHWWARHQRCQLNFSSLPGLLYNHPRHNHVLYSNVTAAQELLTQALHAFVTHNHKHGRPKVVYPAAMSADQHRYLLLPDSYRGRLLTRLAADPYRCYLLACLSPDPENLYPLLRCLFALYPGRSLEYTKCIPP